MNQYELNLMDYWRIILKRKWVIAGIFIIVLLSTFFYSKQQKPVFEAATRIKIYARTPIAAISGTEITFWGGQSTLDSEIELIKSNKVLSEVVIKLGFVDKDASDLQIEQAVERLRGQLETDRVGNTDLVDIIGRNSDPKMAMNMVMEVTYAYRAENWRTKINEAQTTREFIEKQLKATEENLHETEDKLTHLKEKGDAIGSVMPMQSKLSELKLQLSNLSEKFTDNHPDVIRIREDIHFIEKQLKEMPEKELNYARLTRELKTNEELYALLKEQYAKAQIVEASQINDVEIVNPAVEPKAPLSSNKGRNIFVGAILGVILGFVAALVSESVDTSIGTIEDVEEYLKLPVLGAIPHIAMKNHKEDFWKKSSQDTAVEESLITRLITQYRPQSLVAEAYRNLQTNIEFNGLDKVGNTFAFTSVSSQEGKTVTVTNCALSFAQMGSKVLLIDADLRRPAIHKIFGLRREGGLNEVLVGSLPLESAIKTIMDILVGDIKVNEILKNQGIENLNILTSGHLPSNPSELLASKRMADLIQEVKDRFDVVLVDCAPIMPVTDPILVGSKVNGVVLVYQVGRVARGLLKRAKMQLESAKAHPIGVVLNNLRSSDMDIGYPYYGYNSNHYYSLPEEKKK